MMKTIKVEDLSPPQRRRRLELKIQRARQRGASEEDVRELLRKLEIARRAER